ncbi:MAG: hypothetical protein IJN03_00500 [Bacilli bacterium]|nr:hypothetical protein [Bacilli bacterium]
MRNKKTVITVTSIVAVLLVIIGVTYAYWLVTKTQTNQNIISSGCLDISLSGEKNDIELQDQFPLSDEDGMKLTPYEFTVTNNCTTSVDYYVNLESLGIESSAISASALKIALNDNVSILGDNYETDKTISEAYVAHRIAYGTLAAKDTENASVTYELRIWIDANAPISEQNKTFQSKISVTVGQGVNNPLKEGTLAYDLVSNYGGASNAKEVQSMKSTTYIESDWIESSASIWYEDEIYWGTDYEYDEYTHMFTLTGDVVLATHAECNAGTKNCGEYFVGTEGDGCGYEVCGWTSNKLSDEVLLKRDYELSPDAFLEPQWWSAKLKLTVATTTTITETTTGLYKALDDLGTSYYLKGDITNNYVKFGKWNESVGGWYGGSLDYGPFDTLEACQAESENGAPWMPEECFQEIIVAKDSDMIWQIVRINGDGTIRLALVKDVLKSQYNSIANDTKYVGFTYDDGSGNQIDSTIKDVLDLWYETNLKGTYDKYIADEIFCNDRSAGFFDGEYGFDSRLIKEAEHYSRIVPTLICKNQADRYTVSNSKGNSLLTNPVGLLTADEYLLSSIYDENATSYTFSGHLYQSSPEFWTMTPSSGTNVYVIGSMGEVTPSSIDLDNIVYPVINLKADVKFTGTGEYETPYEIVTE